MPPPHVHSHTFRVVMAEVDASQIHFTAIFRWMDRGMSEWLAAIGRPFTYVLAEGPGLPIVEAKCRFLGRIMLDDELILSTYVTAVGRTSFRSRHDFARGDEIVAAGELVHVCVDRPTRTPVPVPDWIREHEVAEPPAPDAG